MSFRQRLADQIEINLWSMEGFGGNQKSWNSVEDDIVPLLSHSDCDGFIPPEQCHLIAARLSDLIQTWDDNDYDKIQAKSLIDGLNYCYEHNEELELC